MHWSELEAAQPGLAELARERLLVPGVVLVATVWQSAKAADLLRDPRILVHSVVTGRDGAEGEFKIRGTARAEHDPDVQRRYSNAVTADLGWTPTPGRFHLFAVMLDDVAFIRYDDATGDQHVAMGPPAREFIRRGDGGTSLREPEPAHDIITAG